jgi:hypothetical protein
VRHLNEEELSDLVDGVGGADGVPGEAADGVAADHVAACPECRARVDVRRRIRARLAAGGPVPEGRREEAVAAAMEAAPSFRGGRRPPRRRSGRALAGAGLAAAAAVAALAIGLTRTGGSGPAHVSARPPTTVARNSGVPTASGASGAAASGAASSVSAGSGSAGSGSSFGAAGPSAAAPVESLGAIDSPQSLVAAVQRALGSQQPVVPQPATRYAPASCQVPPKDLGSANPPLLLQATAVYRSTPVVVYVYRVGNQRRAYGLDTRTCSLLVEATA